MSDTDKPAFRFTPGIPLTPNGIAATVDANALRHVYGDAMGGFVTDDELDAFARQRFAELEAGK